MSNICLNWIDDLTYIINSIIDHDVLQKNPFKLEISSNSTFRYIPVHNYMKLVN